VRRADPAELAPFARPIPSDGEQLDDALMERYLDLTDGGTIPIIVVSTAGAVPRSAYVLGVRRFIPKPFEPRELTATLAEITSRASA